jgi:uncharacterized protein YegJ (DUF2314 family)
MILGLSSKAVLICAVAICVMAGQVTAQQDNTVTVAGDNALMNAAIAKARASLPVFWEKFKSPSRRDKGFAVKVEITDGPGSEHFWCVEIKLDDNGATCSIGNQPAFVKSVVYGQRISIDTAKISDWMYYRDDRIVGGQTIRALIPSLSTAEAEYYQNLLAPEQ